MSVTGETAGPVGNHVFISYSKTDRAFAETVCARLESAGVKCWMAPRDILPGAIWGEAIIDAIMTSRLMILVFSRAANKSHQVAREVERAASHGVPLLPLRIEDLPLSKALELYLSTSQWLDAYTPPREQHLDRLVAAVQKLVASAPSRRSSQSELRRVSTPLPAKRRSRANPRIIAASGVLAAIAAIAGSVWAFGSAFSGGDESPPPTTKAPVVRIAGARSMDRQVGDTFTVSATVDAIPVLSSSAIRWRSSDTTVARVAATTGVTLAVAPGVAVLFAEASGSSDSVRVGVRAAPSVTPRPTTVASLRLTQPPSLRVGDSLRLQIAAEDSAGRPLTPTRVFWRSSAPRVASIDSARGVLRANAPGQTTITARVGSASATAVTTIVERPPVKQPPPRGLRDSIVPPNVPVSPQPTAPVTPALTAAIRRTLAEECVGALRRRDRVWLSGHYAPETGADQANLAALSDLIGRRDYSAEEIALNTGDPLTDFQMRLSYANSFGRRRTTNVVFTVSTALVSGRWEVKSCRIRGTLVLP